MAKRGTAYWDDAGGLWFPAVVAAALAIACVLLVAPAAAGGSASSRAAAAASGAAGSRPAQRRWTVPKASGRLTAKDLGLVINLNDPYSVEVGEFYAHARQLAPDQILRVELPVKASLTPQEFQALE